MARRPLGDIGNTHTSQLLLQRDRADKRLFQGRSPRADESRRGNPLFVSQYVPEIMETLRLAETKFMASPTYMNHQTDINDKMRAILVDWLVDVHLKFKLLPETLYLALTLIDRFLDQKVVTRSKLQLVGVVAMLLAAKYEEIYPPEIKDFIYISANTYSKDDILRMERLMLTSLEFSLTSPSTYQFLKRCLQVVDADPTCQHMALYLSELAMMEYKMLQFPPSVVAAGCVYVARKILQHPDPWNWILEYYTSHTISNLQMVAMQLYEVVGGSRQHKCQAIRKKYSYPKFNGVSERTDVTLHFP